MRPSDLLIVFIQVAVTLAGFTGVVALIDRGAARVSDELASFRVRYLVIAALTVIVFSTLPFFATFFGAPEGETWRWGCAIEAVYTVYYLVRIVLMRRTFKGEKGLGINLRQYYVFTALGAGTVLVLIAGFTGFVSAAASYVLGVFWFVLAVAIFFMRLVFMLDDSSRNRPQ